MAGLMAAPRARQVDDSSWTSRFDVDRDDLVSIGRNRYFILEPGYTLVLEDGRERLVITVLTEMRRVDGVDTRIVEERETKNADLIEVSRNYFAISKRTNAVFYFGENVDMYQGGKVVNHDGSWLAGVNGARFGLMMPGLPLVGSRYYQELASPIALDRAEIVSVSEHLRTPAGDFKDVLKIEETTPLEAGSKEYKYFARGIGLLQEGSLKLVKFGGSTP